MAYPTNQDIDLAYIPTRPRFKNASRMRQKRLRNVLN